MNREVFILTAEAPEGPGGVEHFVRELGKGLTSCGYRVRFFHRQNCVPAWLRAPANRWMRYLSDVLMGYWIGRAAARQLGNGVAAAISNGPVGWFPFRCRAGAKWIHFYHGTYRGQAEAIRPWITPLGYLKLKWWDAMVLERASGWRKLCLANSDQTRDEVARFFRWNAATLWLPLDTSSFRPLDRNACRDALGLPRDAVVGLFVGSAEPAKGLPVVQQLVREFEDVHWLVVLRGGPPVRFPDGRRVSVLKDLAQDHLPSVYSAADFLLCPSRYESFGYVVAEAVACGLPVIASPGGASRALLDQPPLDELLVAAADDAAAFAAGVRRVLADPARYRSAILERARARVEAWMAPENWWRCFRHVSGL